MRARVRGRRLGRRWRGGIGARGSVWLRGVRSGSEVEMEGMEMWYEGMKVSSADTIISCHSASPCRMRAKLSKNHRLTCSIIITSTHDAFTPSIPVYTFPLSMHQSNIYSPSPTSNSSTPPTNPSTPLFPFSFLRVVCIDSHLHEETSIIQQGQGPICVVA